jgi:hypothetical protein
MIECDYCGTPYDGTRYRWLCPVCKMKSSCCEGAPCPVPSAEANKGCKEAREQTRIPAGSTQDPGGQRWPCSLLGSRT